MSRSLLILVFSCAATLSVNMVLVRRARMDLPVPIFGLLQMFLTSCGLLAFALLRQGKNAFRGFKQDIPTAIVIGLIACGITAGILVGITESSATAGAVLMRTDILFTIVIGWFLVGDRLRARDVPFLLILTAGALAVMEARLSDFKLENPYNLYFICSALGISINAFLIKYRIRVMGWAILAWVNTAVQSVFYAALVLLFNRDIVNILGEQPSSLWWVFGASVWLVAYFLTYYESLERMPVWYVRVFLLTMPVFTITLEYPLFGTIPRTWQLIGIGLVTIGVLGLALNRKQEEEHTRPTDRLMSDVSPD